LRRLGKGGMGEVFQARDEPNDRMVAIKVLSKELLDDEEAVHRFMREARSLGEIKHKNIAQIYETGRKPEGGPYIVIEFIDGPNFDHFIKFETDFSYSRWLEWMIQASEGLEAAARMKVIHRDIKPANLMITTENVVKILDFGIAKVLREDTFKTTTGTILGTPRYMSPEQSLGQALDHRSDIYSLGASFYHILGGQSPFEADTPISLMMKHVSAPLTPLYVVNQKIPRDICDIIYKMMAKDPATRYQTYEELISDLKFAKLACASREGNKTEAVIPNPTRTMAVGSGPGSTPSYSMKGVKIDLEEQEEPKKGGVTLSRMILGATAIVFFLLIVTFVIKQFSQGDEDGQDQEHKKSLFSVLLEKRQEQKTQLQVKQELETRRANLLTTEKQMRVVYSLALSYEAQKGSFPSSMQQVVDAGMAGESDAMDAWGQEFMLYPGDHKVVSKGEDAIENTQDDFVLEGDGEFTQKPVIEEDKIEESPQVTPQ
ncbi:MAG: serine/threonine-protein kinase, partial [bacterium]